MIGLSLVDRGKNGAKIHVLSGANGIPLVSAFQGRRPWPCQAVADGRGDLGDRVRRGWSTQGNPNRVNQPTEWWNGTMRA